MRAAFDVLSWLDRAQATEQQLREQRVAKDKTGQMTRGCTREGGRCPGRDWKGEVKVGSEKQEVPGG